MIKTFIIAPTVLFLALVLSVPVRAEFVRGIFTTGAETFDTISAMGFNLAICRTETAELESAKRLGLKLIPQWFGDDTKSFERIAEFGDDSRIAAWFPFDEPDIYHISQEIVEGKITRLRKYSNKPVFLTVFTPSRYADFFPYADFCGITPYPIGSNPNEIRMEVVGQFSKIARVVSGAKPLYIFVPVFFQRPWQYRAPTALELHNIVYQALTSAPDGILFFIWKIGGLDNVIWNLTDRPDLMKEIEIINHELITLDGVLTAGTDASSEITSASNPLVYYRLVEFGGEYYLFVANPMPRELQFEIGFDFVPDATEIMFGSGVKIRNTDSHNRIALTMNKFGHSVIKICNNNQE